MSDLAINILAMKYKRDLEKAQHKLDMIEGFLRFYEFEFRGILTNGDKCIINNVRDIIEDDEYYTQEVKDYIESNEDNEDGDIF